MILEGKELAFRYQSGARQILNKLSIQIESHERVGIAAPSGFGKTTLCKVLSGYEAPEKGAVTIDGKPLSAYGRTSPVQMIWQHPELVLNPRLTMAKSLSEAGGLDTQICARLGIEEGWLSRYPGELSGGEMQRFSIARALGPATRFLLADEMTAMMDMVTQSQIWHFLLEETRRRHIGMLIVSHSRPLLERVCTRVEQMQSIESALI